MTATVDLTKKYGRVYRCYAKDGRLLYIGSTADIGQRVSVHRTSTLWFFLVAEVRHTGWMDLQDARDAERAAIETERPPLNQQFNPDYYKLRTNKERRLRLFAEINKLRGLEPDEGLLVVNEGYVDDYTRMSLVAQVMGEVLAEILAHVGAAAS